MKDERFMAQYPPEQRMIDWFAKIREASLEEHLGRLIFLLQDLYDVGPLTDYNKMREDILSKIDNEPNLARLIVGWNDEFENYKNEIRDKKKDKDKDRREVERLNYALSIKYATIYIELSYAAKRAGKIHQAWAYAFEAALSCGEINANSAIEETALRLEEMTTRNSGNAKGVNKKINLLKDYIASLIIENAPKEKWPSKSKAISDIVKLETPHTNKNETPQYKYLIEGFISINKIPRVTYTGIEARLNKTWARESAAIRNALERTVRPTKTRKKTSLLEN